MTTEQQWQEIVRLQAELSFTQGCMANAKQEKQAAYVHGFMAACSYVEGRGEHPGWLMTLNGVKKELLQRMGDNFL